MVDFVKRAAGTGDIQLDEEVLAASNVTPTPFVVENAGMAGGVIAGGLAGAAIGAAWDSRHRKMDGADQDGRALPAVAARPQYEPVVPSNGALLAVTTKRVMAWRISAMGKPRDLLLAVPLSAVDSVAWQDADARWLGGRPASLLLWLGVEARVLPCAGISMGPAGKHIKGVVTALTERLPGKVEEWTGG